jgi:hypothetical protein
MSGNTGPRYFKSQSRHLPESYPSQYLQDYAGPSKLPAQQYRDEDSRTPKACLSAGADRGQVSPVTHRLTQDILRSRFPLRTPKTSPAGPYRVKTLSNPLPIPAASSSHVIFNASTSRHHNAPRVGPSPDDDDENAQTTVSANHTRCKTTQLHARTWINFRC